jgi:hypothetical protein
MKLCLLSVLLSTIFLTSCEKSKTCASSMELTTTTRTPTVGDDIVIRAISEGDNEVFQWNGPYTNLTNQNSTLTIDDIKLSHSGTYSCNKANSDCNTSIGDTILIEVQLKQETPPCSLTNNYMSANNTPNATFSSVTQGFHSTWNGVYLEGYSGFGSPTLLVVFNSYNGNVEPRDGVHLTTEGPTFNVFDEPNEVSVSFISSSTFYHSQPDQKVYVSHVGGKLRVSFCNLIFSGAGGLGAPNTTCTARMTEF